MKRIIILLLLVLPLSGCATYKFQHGKGEYSKGYLASRGGYPILEYTVGSEGSVPADLPLAKERFKRRRHTVESYYKQMGYIENRFRQAFWDPGVYFVKLVSGVFRMPAVAISDYRYRHDAKYREKVRRVQDEEDAREESRMNKLKEELSAYIRSDMAAENTQVTPPVEAGRQQVAVPKQEEAVQRQAAVSPPQKSSAQEEINKTLAQIESAAPLPEAVQPKPKSVPSRKEKPVKAAPKQKPAPPKAESRSLPKAIKAVIIARPAKGYSPLRVHLLAGESYSSHGRIIAYNWDFGDGDVSTKKDPVNTYWSVSYEPRYYTVSLTVTDDLGNTATSQQTIEVLNK